MRVLLDTCSFLWLDSEPSRIGDAAQKLLLSTETSPLLSHASIWEMAIKRSLGKLPASQPLDTIIASYVKRGAIMLQPIELGHVLTVERLPLHHRDPFDRLIAAQALVEGIPLISADFIFDSYGVQRVWK